MNVPSHDSAASLAGCRTPTLAVLRSERKWGEQALRLPEERTRRTSGNGQHFTRKGDRRLARGRVGREEMRSLGQRRGVGGDHVGNVGAAALKRSANVHLLDRVG